jgi:hypothetical protein
VRSGHHEQGTSTNSYKNTKPIHTSAAESDVKAAREEIKALKSQLNNVKGTGSPAQSISFSWMVPQGEKKLTPFIEPVARPHKGASLANPNKKARKYQAIEFESDDDE